MEHIIKKALILPVPKAKKAQGQLSQGPGGKMDSRVNRGWRVPAAGRTRVGGEGKVRSRSEAGPRVRGCEAPDGNCNPTSQREAPPAHASSSEHADFSLLIRILGI